MGKAFAASDIPHRKWLVKSKPVKMNLFLFVHFIYFCTNEQSNLLLRPVYISRFLAGFLLIVFSFSITPKNYLHSLFAKHTDCKYEKRSDNQYHLTYAGYNCYADNLVVESSFDNDLPVISVPAFKSYSSYIVKNISFTSVTRIYSSLRGPPVNI